MNRHVIMFRFAAALLFIAVSIARGEGPEASNLSHHYGFAPLEVSEADRRLFGLTAGTFGGDERLDLAGVDNSRSRIVLYVQRQPEPEASGSEVNSYELPGRFEEVALPVDREVNALASGDFDGDGADDLATLETKDWLEVRRNAGKAGETEFESMASIRLPDSGEDPFDLAAGDLNGDGRDDLVALGVEATYVLMSDEDGRNGFAQPVRILNTSDDLDLCSLSDFDGDGALDLLYGALGEEGYSLCIRLQRDGRLGAEIRMPADSFTALYVGQADGGAEEEVFTVDGDTGRVGVMRLERVDQDAGKEPTLVQYGLGGSARSERDWAVADLDGDGRPEVVVSDPSAPELLLFRQESEGLEPAERFPSLLGIRELHAADLDDDGRQEILVLSEEEETVGIVRLEDGKLTLPEVLSVPGTPVSAAVSDGGQIMLLVKDGKSSREKSTVVRLARTSSGWSSAELEWSDEAVDKKLDRADLALLEIADFDGDGQPELLVTAKRTPLLVLAIRENGLTPLEAEGGVALPEADADQVTVGEDGRSLLVARGKFARRLSVNSDGQWTLAEQFNPPASGASVDAVLELSDGVALVDNGSDRLWRLDSEGRLKSELETDGMRVQAARAGDFDGDGQTDVLLLAGDRLAAALSGRENWQLKTVLTHQPEDDDDEFADVAAGDLNADGVPDLISIDADEHVIEIAALSGDPLKATKATRWVVFEDKDFGGGRGRGGMQPRAALTADVTGDGREDLILLAHDRMLLYPQDSPESADAESPGP